MQDSLLSDDQTMLTSAVQGRKLPLVWPILLLCAVAESRCLGLTGDLRPPPIVFALLAGLYIYWAIFHFQIHAQLRRILPGTCTAYPGKALICALLSGPITPWIVSSILSLAASALAWLEQTVTEIFPSAEPLVQSAVFLLNWGQNFLTVIVSATLVLLWYVKDMSQMACAWQILKGRGSRQPLSKGKATAWAVLSSLGLVVPSCLAVIALKTPLTQAITAAEPGWLTSFASCSLLGYLLAFIGLIPVVDCLNEARGLQYSRQEGGTSQFQQPEAPPGTSPQQSH